MLEVLVTGGLLLTLVPIIGAVGWLGLRTRTRMAAGGRFDTGPAFGTYSIYGAVGRSARLDFAAGSGLPRLLGLLTSRERGPFGSVAYIFEYNHSSSGAAPGGQVVRSQAILAPANPDPAEADTIEQAVFIGIPIRVIVYTSAVPWGPMPGAIVRAGSRQLQGAEAFLSRV